MTSPGSLTRYAAIKKASVHATLREEIAPETGTNDSWFNALLQCAEQADELAASCLRDAKTWDARGDQNYADYLRAEAERHTDRADDYRMRASWVPK